MRSLEILMFECVTLLFVWLFGQTFAAQRARCMNMLLFGLFDWSVRCRLPVANYSLPSCSNYAVLRVDSNVTASDL
jgi:hypothetical protein